MNFQQIVMIILQYSKNDKLSIHNAVAPGVLQYIGIIFKRFEDESHRLRYMSCHGL